MSIELYAFLEEDLHLDETLIIFIFYHNRSGSNIYIVKRVFFFNLDEPLYSALVNRKISVTVLSEFIWITPFSWLT